MPLAQENKTAPAMSETLAPTAGAGWVTADEARLQLAMDDRPLVLLGRTAANGTRDCFTLEHPGGDAEPMLLQIVVAVFSEKHREEIRVVAVSVMDRELETV